MANKEENRELDVRRLRESGVAVWVTDIETVPEAVDSPRAPLRRGARLGAAGLAGRGRASCGAARCPTSARDVAIPVWRDPWMVVGRDTFTGDLARRLGWANVFADSTDRYPKVDPAEVEAPGVDARAAPRRALRLHRRRRAGGVPAHRDGGWSAAGC